jgi:uncharacterized OsmC-like protein
MNADELRAVQGPLKTRYKTEPDAARLVVRARGTPDTAAQVCRVETHIGVVEAGLHPATGGDGSKACSFDMLLEALVACAGVTLGAVATSMGIAVRGGRITAEGDIDIRGTLGVSRDVPVGFERIRLKFDLETEAPPEQVKKLIELTERYCVVLQTLRKPPEVTSAF